MTDREMLELAAKAAGLYGHRYCEAWKAMAAYTTQDGYHGPSWNPIADDGDALRLAVKCGIALDRTGNRCWAWVNGWERNGVCEEFYGNDPYAATRRAIVRAAAELGATSRA